MAATLPTEGDIYYQRDNQFNVECDECAVGVVEREFDDYDGGTGRIYYRAVNGSSRVSDEWLCANCTDCAAREAALEDARQNALAERAMTEGGGVVVTTDAF